MNKLKLALLDESNVLLEKYLSNERVQDVRKDLSELVPKKECPECSQNIEFGMNFCALCGRVLWDVSLDSE